MSPIGLPRDILEFARILHEAGQAVYIVGGAIRDSLLGRRVTDYDAATDATPERVMSLFKRVVPTGIKHGTVTVLFKGRSIETTTFRSESGYSDGRHPDLVRFGTSIEEDLERRDFTINALAWDPIGKRLVDPHSGRADLSAGLVRAVGDPGRRFDEDGLRILRALRLACQLDFTIEAETYASIPSHLERLGSVSAERVRDEVLKILEAKAPSKGFRLMEGCGVLRLLLPELADCRGVEQRGLHRFDVLDHLLVAVDAAEPRLEIRLAALFHDLGKPQTRVVDESGSASFHCHEEHSARMAEAIMKRLRFPSLLISTVAHLVRQHMFFYEEGWTDAAVRRFVARVGKDRLDDLLALRLADSAALQGTDIDPRALEALRSRIEALLAQDSALGIRDLALGGNELAELGIPRGPVMGRILGELLEAVLDDPELNEASRLSEIARRLKGKHGLPD